MFILYHNYVGGGFLFFKKYYYWGLQIKKVWGVFLNNRQDVLCGYLSRGRGVKVLLCYIQVSTRCGA
jgi:hypothetical protein